jgi:hypothetical protein
MAISNRRRQSLPASPDKTQYRWELVHRREHRCGIAMPGRRERKRLGIGYGAVVKVVSCGCLWKWDGNEWWRSQMGREYDLALVREQKDAKSR